MATPHYPLLYQIKTCVWLTEWSRRLGRAATLDDIPDTELDRMAEMGFDWVWFLSVWQTGLRGQQVSRSNHEWRREFEETLPDLREEDIPGSGFAITGYRVHQALGGDAAFLGRRDSCYEPSVLRSSKMFGFHFHIIVYPDDFYRKSSTLKTCPDNRLV
jgi:hypothetical protein